jgi:CBS domain-containing protein
MHTVRDYMTKDPVVCRASDNCCDAAEAMRDKDVGDVLVAEENDSGLCGIVTDRDIVVRCVAEAKDPKTTPLKDVCSQGLYTLGPDDDIKDAIKLMRDHAIRRIPVIEDGQPVGILSIGDLAKERDRESVLGEISAAPPNH